MAFWFSEESANPDTEIVNAIRPTMATVPGALLLGISSPYARRGVLWDAYRQHYAQDGDPVLVWNASTTAMNGTISEAFVAAELEKDEAAARAEYLAEFRTDVETFVSREVVEACIDAGRHESPPVRGVTYRAFTDPSGGGSDRSRWPSPTPSHARGAWSPCSTPSGRSAHRSHPSQRPPISPRSSAPTGSPKSSATGTRANGRASSSASTASRIWSPSRPKSDLYRDALPHLNSQSVALLDHPRLVAQLCGLERRTSRGGRDSIDHGPHGHDDVANSVCGVLANLLVHQPGADGGVVPIHGGTLRFDLAQWNQVPGTERFNSGRFDWSDLDEQDQRTRRRYGLP